MLCAPIARWSPFKHLTAQPDWEFHGGRGRCFASDGFPVPPTPPEDSHRALQEQSVLQVLQEYYKVVLGPEAYQKNIQKSNTKGLLPVNDIIQIPDARLHDIVKKQSSLFSLEGKLKGNNCLAIQAICPLELIIFPCFSGNAPFNLHFLKAQLKHAPFIVNSTVIFSIAIIVQ